MSSGFMWLWMGVIGRMFLNRVTNYEFHNSRESADYLADPPFGRKYFAAWS
jgi:hypothetical protein